MPGSRVSRESIGAPATDSHPLDAGAAVALIAEEGPRERIGAVLEEQGWELIAFQEVEDLIEHDDEYDSRLVAVWVDDASANADGKWSRCSAAWSMPWWC